MSTVLFFDLVGGAAGDMLLASLLDLGVATSVVENAWTACGLSRVSLKRKDAFPAGLRAHQVDVMVNGHLADTDVSGQHSHHHPHRPYKDIRRLLQESSLSPRVKDLSLAAFACLAKAESEAHGIPEDDVEFHEVGSDDAIADIVGVAAAVTELEVHHIVCSPFPVGHGMIRSAHGMIPLPAPATLKLSVGVPTISTNIEGELVTPTGAAVLRAMVDDFGSMPSMTVKKIGLGAGHKSWPERPNIVRAVLGETSTSVVTSMNEEVVLETNIDDMTAQQFAALFSALQNAGAIDVWAQPITMKKSRTGQLLSMLVRRESVSSMLDVLFSHSTTLGVREMNVVRHRMAREIKQVETKYGSVRVKLRQRPHGHVLCVPEYEDCLALAQKNELDVMTIQQAAVAAFWAKHEST